MKANFFFLNLNLYWFIIYLDLYTQALVCLLFAFKSVSFFRKNVAKEPSAAN